MVKRVAKFKQMLLQNCPVYQVKPVIVIYCLPSQFHSKVYLSVGVFGVFKASPTISSGSLCCSLYFLRSHAMCTWNRMNHKRLQLQRNILCNKYPRYYSVSIYSWDAIHISFEKESSCRSHLIFVDNSSVTVVHKGSWWLWCSLKFLGAF